MTTHILSMTYQPKIEGVRNGTIRQTIRIYNPKRPFKVGDKLLIHGWEGRMYRSPWSWRMEEVVKELDRLDCDSDVWVLWDNYDLKHEGFCSAVNPYECQHDVIDAIAKADGISPATGLELKNVLERYHGKFTDKPVRFQVIRW